MYTCKLYWEVSAYTRLHVVLAGSQALSVEGKPTDEGQLTVNLPVNIIPVDHNLNCSYTTQTPVEETGMSDKRMPSCDSYSKGQKKLNLYNL